MKKLLSHWSAFLLLTALGLLLSFNQVSTSFAQEEAARSIPLTIYNDAARKILLQEELDKFPKEERTPEVVARAILKVDSLLEIPEVGALEIVEGRVVGFTGSKGSIVGLIPKGNYKITMDPIAGIDMYYPDQVSVGVSGTNKISIGLLQGEGTVNPIEEQDKGLFGNLPNFLINETYAQEQTVTEDEINFGGQAPVEVQLFNDTNKNGIQDEGETDVPWAGVRIELAHESFIVSYELFEGWNFISLPVVPQSIKTAKDLVEDVAMDGGYVTTVSVWDGDRWDEYSQRGGEPYGHDFEIVAAQAYFLENHKQTTWTVAGEVLQEAKLTLTKGWNGIGIPLGDYSAESALDSLQTAAQPETGEAADQLAKWTFGIWEVLVKRIFSPEQTEVYGFDFPILNNQGYFIFAKQDIIWKP